MTANTPFNAWGRTGGVGGAGTFSGESANTGPTMNNQTNIAATKAIHNLRI